MPTVRQAVVPLRILLIVLFLILLVFQFMSLPGQFSYMAREEPDLAYLRWPLTLVTGFWVLCAQVVVVCTWRLLTLVTQERIFSPDAFRWVDGIVTSFAALWVTLVAFSAYFGLRADDPGGPMVLMLLTTAVTVAALLMVVMRALLHQATALRSDLEAVI